MMVILSIAILHSAAHHRLYQSTATMHEPESRLAWLAVMRQGSILKRRTLVLSDSLSMSDDMAQYLVSAPSSLRKWRASCFPPWLSWLAQAQTRCC